MPGLTILSDVMITIIEGLGLTCYTRESSTATDVGRVNHIVDIVLSESYRVPTCDYIPIFFGSAPCMLKTKKLSQAHGKLPVLAH